LKFIYINLENLNKAHTKYEFKKFVYLTIIKLTYEYK